jgi:hypothetical protein
MASITLAASANLSQDQLIAGIIEEISTVNPIFESMVFDGIEGNSLAFNRENVLGDAQAIGVGDTVTANAAARTTRVTTSLTTLIGDADINNLINTTRSDQGNDQTGYQIASKAKTIARLYQNYMVNGTGAGDQFLGLKQMTAASQKVDTGVNGGALSLTMMDDLLSLVIAKDGQVDWMMMPVRTINSYRQLIRTLGGTTMDQVQMPSGRNVIAYEGIPIYRNDWIPIDETKGNGTAQTTIYAGCWDDGSRSNGLAGLTTMTDAGISLTDVGELEARDERRWRIRWYCGLALFSTLGLASADGITN